MARLRTPIRALSSVLLVPALLAGCEAGYYAQLIRGGWDVLQRRTPIAELVAAPGTDPTLRERLQRAQQAREFAVRELRLPDSGSFRDYADVGRPFVLWNVFAAPELSLAPHEWCYPLAGCMAYRGWYARERAEAEAARLREQGFDAWVGGVPAYSTLGWFDDPLLNTLVGDEADMVATIFHELAHPRLYVKGDTAFDESFASFVELEGLRAFLREAPELAAGAAANERHEREVLDRMLAARAGLEALYASPASDAAKRQGKARVLDDLREALVRAGYVPGALNNARLLTVGLYRKWVPAFARLFAQAGGDWERFYGAAETLAALEPEARAARLEELSSSPRE